MARRASITWDDLRIALAVQRRGSHGGAARLLGVDPTTIGRRLGALERGLGARLFDRTPAGLIATAEGAALALHAERVEAEVLAAERALGGADERVAGTVRVTASDGLVHALLVPALPGLRRAHPGLAIDLRPDLRALDLSRREADVAVRLGRPRERSLVARRFGTTRFALFASRAYLERRGTPRSAADLARHDLVGFDASQDRLPQVRWLARAVGRPRWAVRATTTTAQALAAAEGLGVVLLATYVGARDARLVPILPALHPPPREAWIVVHQDMRRNARVAAVMAWLAEVGAAAGKG